jgi:ABC transporter substrate binding protein
MPDPVLFTHRLRINTLALGARLPTMHSLREYVEASGLISYGPSWQDQWRRAADYVDKILRGKKPADIPVEQPTRFDLIVNRTTAQALGITVPEMARARQRGDRIASFCCICSRPVVTQSDDIRSTASRVPSFCSIGTILPPRPAHSPCRRAQRRSRMARLRATASAARSVLDGREHDGMLDRVGAMICPPTNHQKAYAQGHQKTGSRLPARRAALHRRGFPRIGRAVSRCLQFGRKRQPPR